MLHLLYRLRQQFFLFLITFQVVVLGGCGMQELDTQLVIGKAVAAHGWQDYKQGVVSFRQEQSLFRVLRDADARLYSRTFRNKAGEEVHDVLTSSGLVRKISNTAVPLTPEEELTESEHIKEAVFFALFPADLQEATIQQKHIGNVRVLGQPYYKIHVVLPKHGNSNETEEARTHVLWIHRQRHTLDYLVSVISSGRGGVVFSKAINPREVGGIRFQDYIHYTTRKRITTSRLDYAFEAGELEQFSETRLQDIKVNKLPQQ